MSTAIPSIVHNLGGFSEFPWVFSIYLLTQAVTVPIYGRHSDVFGRKPVLFFGIGIFLIGSALSGAAWSMVSLIVFRGLQGIGAGAVQPIAMTIVGDLYSAQERAKIQGFLASVWAISAVIGPLAGGMIVKYFSWPWIFWMNLPIGLVASAGFVVFLHENLVPQQRKIDHWSAGIFMIAIASVMAALTAI